MSVEKASLEPITSSFSTGMQGPSKVTLPVEVAGVLSKGREEQERAASTVVHYSDQGGIGNP
ncbi:MAG: hypothetical protein RMJ98_19770 [Myxococcales bacterium]|nr:hypothetical protein [Myxococcales bacterium]